MILPDNDECQRVIMELDGEPNLTEWEMEFVESNIERLEFTDAQKLVIAKLKKRFAV